jgi:hypothetical protein
LQSSGASRRGDADSHLKLARKDKAPSTMIFFAAAAFPIVPKTLYGAGGGFAIGRLGLSINIKGLR